jgi:transposase
MKRRPPGRPLRIRWRPDDTAPMLRLRYLREKDPLVRTRLQLLWRVRRGDRLKEAAEHVGVSERAAQKWIAQYRTAGLRPINAPRRHGGGRTSPLSDAQWDQLRERLRGGTTRTAAQLVAWVRTAFGVSYRPDSLRYALHRHRIRLKVPRPRHIKSDPDAQEAWKKGGSQNA